MEVTLWGGGMKNEIFQEQIVILQIWAFHCFTLRFNVLLRSDDFEDITNPTISLLPGWPSKGQREEAFLICRTRTSQRYGAGDVCVGGRGFHIYQHQSEIN